MQAAEKQLPIATASVKERKRQYLKRYYEENRERLIAAQKDYSIANREKISEKTRAYRNANSEDIAKWKKEHYADNSDRILEVNRQWRLRNKEKIAEASRLYREANKEKIAAKKRSDYNANREKFAEKGKSYRSTPEFKNSRKARDSSTRGRLINRCRARVSKAFSREGFQKTTNTATMIGCSWEHLKAHIEKQFVRGMSWKNRDGWHIDHIIPLASAKTNEEIVALCHFSNLQPLWKLENIAKSSKIVSCQPELAMNYL
jgi:hypothetical protein